MGAGAVLCAPAAVGMAGDALVGTGLITGSTALFSTGTSLYQTATIMEANIAFGSPGKPLPKFEYKSESYPEILSHDYDAQANGKPTTLTYTNDRALQDSNRHDSLSGIKTKPGLDRHEYPYASTYQGGKGASANTLNRTQNQIHGKDLRLFYGENNRVDGFRFFVNTGYWSFNRLPYNFYTGAVGLGTNPYHYRR